MADLEKYNNIDPKYSENYNDADFWSKITGVLKSAGKEVIYNALLLYYVMTDSDCPMTIKATVIIVALGYFISPVDLIPDFIPVLGFTDDLGVLLVAVKAVSSFVDPKIKRLAKNKLDELFGAGTSDGL